MLSIHRTALKWLLAVVYLFVLIATTLFQSSVSYAAIQTLHVTYNRVLTSTNQPYVSEGISVYGGLESRHYNANQANIYAQIYAASMYWHANTIRLQVAESNLFSHLIAGQVYNADFLTAINEQVNYSHSLGMAVVINDQTEFTNNTPNPTALTARFWQIMTEKYKTKPYVIFDIFNEPRLTSQHSTNKIANDVPFNPFIQSHLLAYHTPVSHMPPQQAWQLWRYGGVVDGAHYIGMQNIVDQIRSDGAPNIIWVEGTYEAQRLPPDNDLLTGSNLVYAIHHPNLNSPRSWQRISTLAATHPVVEGEWAQYQSSWSECYSNAYKYAPKYLSFLHSHNIGIIAWSLQANSLVKGGEHVGQPNNLNTSHDPVQSSALKTPNDLLPSYACGNKHGQGVGSLLQKYFSQNSTSYQF
jgi:hypothetical protein